MTTQTKRQPSLPTTFQENHRHYMLDISTEGRMGRNAQTAEGCLQSIISFPDGAIIQIVARYV